MIYECRVVTMDSDHELHHALAPLSHRHSDAKAVEQQLECPATSTGKQTEDMASSRMVFGMTQCSWLMPDMPVMPERKDHKS